LAKVRCCLLSFYFLSYSYKEQNTLNN
jgi:hypothetical protein